MTFLMSGGGSGGHVIPAIAVARELRRQGHSAFFVGTARGMESKIVPASGFELETIRIGQFNRVPLLTKLKTLAQLPKAVSDAAQIIDRRKPAAVFSMGGYVAAPSMMAARRRNLPVVLMEPNALPGFVSRRLGGSVTRALLSFPDAERFFPKGRTEITGLPVRSEFFEIPPAPPRQPLSILITGGSQGSRKLNEAARDSWPMFATAGWPVRFLHQTGRLTHAEFAPAFEQARVPGEVTEFISDMPAALEAADLVVSRSGAGAVSELSAAGKPSVLVPFPGAADNHQLRNAEAMQRAGAAEVILDSELTGERLFLTTMKYVENLALLTGMSTRARALAKPGAALRAAEVLVEVARP